ncbi:MAG: hypothetical protein U0166_09590 [Acidobacteriota bacterium]
MRGAGQVSAAMAALMAAAPSAAAVVMPFEERLNALERIERVYDARRTWPEVNRRPKPAFTRRLSREALARKAERALRESAALDVFFEAPITAGDLRAEWSRMSRDTHDPAMLREILEAAGHDELTVLECVVRPGLAARRFRERYASDRRTHPAVRDAGCLGLAIPILTTPGESPDAWLEHLPMPQDWRTPAIDLDAAGPHRPERAGIHSDPDPRIVGQALWTGSEMLVFGKGACRGGRYDPATDEWHWIPSVPSSLYPNATVVWTGSEAILWGGSDGQYYSNWGAKYDPVAETWTPIGGLPAARYRHSAVWTGTEMIVWGGQVANHFPTNTGGRYDPVTDSWTPTGLGAGTPSPREVHTAVWTGQTMIVWGGQYFGTLGDGASYDPVADSWNTLPSSQAPSARVGHCAVWTGSTMLVWGGETFSPSQELGDGAAFDPVANVWRPVSLLNAPSPRHGHTMICTGSEAIVWGGSGPAQLLEDGGRYDVASDTWRPTAVNGSSPVARIDHCAAWTGTEMIVTGGTPASGTGGRYDPVADSWTPTRSEWTAPIFGSGVVWDGAEMIVWGGNDLAGNVTNQGGRYDPALDAWTPTALTTGVPPPAILGAAVWTGTEMIVWGGSNGQEGGRYDPLTDSWAATTTGGAPEPRQYPTGVWTGTEMIVWGGEGNGGGLDTGGRYDPVSDSWRPTSTGAGCPAPRYWHACVFTGSLMIVWGGAKYGVYYGDGSLYDPASDSWLPMTGAGAPSARWGSTAVWTGVELIVWGGYGAGGPLNTGGRYDPVVDSWNTMGVGAGTPVWRSGHTGVWTGQALIVWGGDSGNYNYLDSGGLYIPATDAFGNLRRWRTRRTDVRSTLRCGAAQK